jgi:hypothetical protein
MRVSGCDGTQKPSTPPSMRSPSPLLWPWFDVRGRRWGANWAECGCDGMVVAEAMGMERFQDNQQDEGSVVPTWSSTLLQYVLWVELDNKGVGS